MSNNQSQQSSSELENFQGNNNTVPENLPGIPSNQLQQSLSELESDQNNNKSAPENPPATPIEHRTNCMLNSGNQLQQSSSELETLREQMNRNKLQKYLPKQLNN